MPPTPFRTSSANALTNWSAALSPGSTIGKWRDHHREQRLHATILAAVCCAFRTIIGSSSAWRLLQNRMREFSSESSFHQRLAGGSSSERSLAVLQDLNRNWFSPFRCDYQQRPLPPDGLIFKRDRNNGRRAASPHIVFSRSPELDSDKIRRQKRFVSHLFCHSSVFYNRQRL